MNQDHLHVQADRIEWLLATHKAPARVLGGRVTPRAVQFHLALSPVTKIAKLEGLAEEIALALNVPSARVSRLNGQLSIEIPRRSARSLRLLDLFTRVGKNPELSRLLAVPGTALLGRDVDGMPLLLRLSSPDVSHVLIAGTTGSGKTELAKTVLASMMFYQKARDLQIIIVDPKGSGFRVFDRSPHLLCPIIADLEDAKANLEWLVLEMQRREILNITRPRIVMLLDELADLLMQGGKEAEASLTRLVQRGRSAGISVVACTQKPTSSAVGSLVKANFPVRLVGKVTSAVDALVASGVAGSGAETLTGHGDFILIAGGEKVRFQAAHLPSSDYETFRGNLNGHPFALAASNPTVVSRLSHQL